MVCDYYSTVSYNLFKIPSFKFDFTGFGPCRGATNLCDHCLFLSEKLGDLVTIVAVANQVQNMQPTATSLQG